MVTAKAWPCVQQYIIKRAFTTSTLISRLRSEWRADRKPADTKLSTRDIVEERKAFGGFKKFKAVEISKGTYTLASQNLTHECLILDVVHSEAGKKYREDKIMSKHCYIKVDVTPIKDSINLDDVIKNMNGSENNFAAMQNIIENSFEKGHMYAKVTSRPGQTGKCDGIILEGNYLVLLMKKLESYKKDESST